MVNVSCDIVNAKRILKGYPATLGNDKYHNKLYFSSNEKLDLVFSGIDFSNKDILSVLSSCDQMFHFYNRGAKNVDTFDINALTIYYYYLRKWVIEYKKRYYPMKNINGKYILSIIDKVNPSIALENDALFFWNELLKSSLDISNLFIFDTDFKKNRIGNLKVIRDIITSREIVFHNIDLSENVCLSKQYDIIYKSNISDYVNGSYNVMKTYRDNLYNMLKDDGLIISSNLCHDYNYANEFGVFSSLFNYELLDNGRGFIYRKRR